MYVLALIHYLIWWLFDSDYKIIMISKKKYFTYLKSRRLSGIIYRYLFIYPFFLRFLGKNTIDYGCGVGDFLRFTTLFKKRCIGFDINNYNIAECKRRGFKVQKISKKFLSKLKINSYDTVVLDNVLEHILNPHLELSVIKKTLKVNGLLVVGIPVGEAGYNSDPDHKVFYDEQRLDNLLSYYDFVKISSFYRPFENNYLRMKLKQYCYFAIYKKLNNDY